MLTFPLYRGGNWGQMKWFIKGSLILSGDAQVWLSSLPTLNLSTASQFSLLLVAYWIPSPLLFIFVVPAEGRVAGQTCVSMVSTWVEDILFKVIESLFPYLRYQGTCSPWVRAWSNRKTQLRGSYRVWWVPSSEVQPLGCGFFLSVFLVRVPSHTLTCFWFISVTGTF